MTQAKTEETALPRWQMHRVGILNFWYYDEEEFQLEQGRIILRGANGSGKSVTMQSFLPLVLDGDKRAHRLDPFGSRDRRIEYYLLGEEEAGKTDVTGYLWMEFRHSGTGAYKTIGIGLRARRHAAQVQFWGFLLEDGRRIGRDCWLYNRNQWIEDQVRVPLDRKGLEALIGSGGQVVLDQKSYQDMVNRHLFGFSDSDAFQDLLQLMIQLRSPKLSKDFKPSAIYEILHQALPPLIEEELRPLSEVLEDMDQMADRLDEVRRHRSELSRLQDRYNTYNEHNLYARSEELLAARAEHAKTDKQVQTAASELAGATRDKEAAAGERMAAQALQQELAAERALLEKHEAIGKQREYESATAALQITETQLERSRDKLTRLRIRQEQLVREQADVGANRAAAERQQRELLEELEGLAADIEFADHALYHRYWTPDVPEHDDWRDGWRRDIRAHRERVEAARAKAVEEQAAAAATKEREIEMGEASQAKDEAERARSELERLLEAEQEAYKEELLTWQRGLRQLGYDQEALREAFGAVRDYGLEQPSLEPIRASLLRRFEEDRETLVAQRLLIERRQSELESERQALGEELRSWQQSREPEPPRSAARAGRRDKLAVGAGVPLYAACDFKPEVSEERKARIEDALAHAGLLDAWIAPDGRMGSLASGEEEAWLLPAPVELGYTLADLLRPDVPEGCGVTTAQVADVLASLLWDEEGVLVGEGQWAGAIAGDGAYRLGPLAGRAVVRERAEYIGRETRKRTRLLEIARLEAHIAAKDGELAETAADIAAAREAERLLVAERDGFPDGRGLASQLSELQKGEHRLQAMLAQEERATARYKEKAAQWRELQRQLHELTAGWTRLKRERDLAEAAEAARDYEAQLSELHALWRQYCDALRLWQRLAEELTAAEQDTEDEEALEDELDERRRDQRTQVETLRRMIEELGLADIARRLEELRREQSEIAALLKRLESDWNAASVRAASAQGQLTVYREQAESKLTELNAASERLAAELALGLVDEWRERLEETAGSTAAKAGQTGTGAANVGTLGAGLASGGTPGAAHSSGADKDAETRALIAYAEQIRERYMSVFEGRIAENITNRMLEQFNTARMLLTEYVMETVTDERTGRLLLLSMRNPQQPLPPRVLLDELAEQEAEQSALLSEKDRELYEEIILRSVGKAIRQRIHRAEQWVREMNRLMGERDTSSGLRLRLDWEARRPGGDEQLDVLDLVELLKRDSHRLRDDEIDAMIAYFRAQITEAKQSAQEEQGSLRMHLYRVLDYRNWFRFELKYRKGEQTGYRPLTDARFNVLSGGEKAMAMYIPLFAATWSRYSDARPDAPRLISLDEAFAGVDEENMRDMFKLLTDMGFDYMMTSQVLWGCFDTVPQLAIYEIHRPKDVDFVTLFRYRWNGRRKEYVEAAQAEQAT